MSSTTLLPCRAVFSLTTSEAVWPSAKCPSKRTFRSVEFLLPNEWIAIGAVWTCGLEEAICRGSPRPVSLPRLVLRQPPSPSPPQGGPPSQDSGEVRAQSRSGVVCENGPAARVGAVPASTRCDVRQGIHCSTLGLNGLVEDAFPSPLLRRAAQVSAVTLPLQNYAPKRSCLAKREANERFPATCMG